MMRRAIPLLMLALAGAAVAMPPRPGIEEPALLREARWQGLIDNPSQGLLQQQLAKGGSAKISGSRQYPVVLGYFTDLAATNTQGEFQEMLFSAAAGKRSVNNYYRDMSYTAMSCSGKVDAWRTSGNTVAYFGNNAYGLTGGTTKNTYEFIRRVLARADSTFNFADSSYDRNHDGYVDVLWVVHAGKGAEETGDSNQIWSHSSQLTNWGPGATYFLTNDLSPFTGSNVRINQYIIMPERTNYADGNSGTTEQIGCGVFCHEFGHALGLPDLYDTGNNSSIAGYGLGLYSLMAAGSWGGNYATNATPVSLDIWSKRFLGWLAPTLITGSGQYYIKSTLSSQTASSYKLAAAGNDHTSQYWLIENRYRAAAGPHSGIPWDSLLLSQGLGIYHIDTVYTSGSYFAGNIVNKNSTNDVSRNRPYGVALEETDMTTAGYSSELWMGTNPGDNADYWSSATQATFDSGGTNYPVSFLNDGTTRTGVSLRNISAVGDSMTFAADVCNDFTIGLLQSPAFPQYLTIAAVANSGLLRPNTLDTALMQNPSGNQPLAFARIGSSRSYQVDYELSVVGTHNIHLAARDSADTNKWRRADRSFEVVSGKTSGGAFRALGGTVQLDLAPGALPRDMLLAVIDNAEAPAQSAVAVGPAIQIGPTLGLGQISQLSLAFDPKGLGALDPSRLGIYRAEGGIWHYLGGVLDEARGRVVAEIDRLGVYQLAWSPENPALRTISTVAEGARPNPFVAKTAISYQMVHGSQVSLKIYNVTGQMVKDLDQGYREPGLHRVIWDGTDHAGRAVASGVYLYRLEADGVVQSGRMAKVR